MMQHFAQHKDSTSRNLSSYLNQIQNTQNSLERLRDIAPKDHGVQASLDQLQSEIDYHFEKYRSIQKEAKQCVYSCSRKLGLRNDDSDDDDDDEKMSMIKTAMLESLSLHDNKPSRQDEIVLKMHDEITQQRRRNFI